MLILTRKPDETLMIGDNITVTVLGIKGNQVRIGVNAPKDVTVNRKEIHQRIKDNVPYVPKKKVATAKPFSKSKGVVVNQPRVKHGTPENIGNK